MISLLRDRLDLRPNWSKVSASTYSAVSLPVFLFALLSCGTSSDKPVAQQPPQPEPFRAFKVPLSREANDAARFLAGLKSLDGSSFAKLEEDPAWIAHAESFQETWARFEGKRLPTLREFRTTSLPANLPAEKLFYPFGGADVITSDSFFPNSKMAVFVGLEPAGTSPTAAQIETAKLDKFLPNLRRTLASLMNISFFKTREMDSQVRGQITDGLLPLFLIQAARLGYEIDGWAPITVSGNGELIGRTADVAGPKGVVFEYHAKGGPPRQILYFGYDLSNKHLTNERLLLTYMEKQKPFQTFFKSASYLPHLGEFTEIRDFAIRNSAAILQDDTGVQYQFLKHGEWDVTLYGAYTKPIPLFWRRVQGDLRKAFEENEQGVKPLSFDIGYGYGRQRSNLLLAIRNPNKPIDEGLLKRVASRSHSKREKPVSVPE